MRMREIFEVLNRPPQKDEHEVLENLSSDLRLSQEDKKDLLGRLPGNIEGVDFVLVYLDSLFSLTHEDIDFLVLLTKRNGFRRTPWIAKLIMKLVERLGWLLEFMEKIEEDWETWEQDEQFGVVDVFSYCSQVDEAVPFIERLFYKTPILNIKYALCSPTLDHCGFLQNHPGAIKKAFELNRTLFWIKEYPKEMREMSRNLEKRFVTKRASLLYKRTGPSLLEQIKEFFRKLFNKGSK